MQWSDDQEFSLHQYEEVIHENRDSFEKMIDALIGIRDERLYLKSHKTFAEYCQKRWKFTARWANYIVSGHDAVKQLTDENDVRTGLTPENIEVLKKSSVISKSAIASVPKRRRLKVAKVALAESAGKPPTAKQIKVAAMKVDGKSAKAIAEAIRRPPPSKAPCGAYTVLRAPVPEPESKPITGDSAVAIVQACYEKNKKEWNGVPPPAPVVIVETIIKALEGK